MSAQTVSRQCGYCHADSAACPFFDPRVRCSSGPASHDAVAAFVVAYVIDLSGRRDFEAGDVEHRILLCCSHPACIGEAESHAHLAGLHVETRPLTREAAEEVTGLDLTAVAS